MPINRPVSLHVSHELPWLLAEIKDFPTLMTTIATPAMHRVLHYSFQEYKDYNLYIFWDSCKPAIEERARLIMDQVSNIVLIFYHLFLLSLSLLVEISILTIYCILFIIIYSIFTLGNFVSGCCS
jgi:hypothetical protein